MGYKKPIVIIFILSLLFIILKRKLCLLEITLTSAIGSESCSSSINPYPFTVGEAFSRFLLFPFFITIYFVVQQLLEEKPTHHFCQ